jgi:anthranilate synthase component 2
VTVFRNDRVTVAELEALKPERIMISPGPCTHKETGVSMEVVKAFGDKLPLLGV